MPLRGSTVYFSLLFARRGKNERKKRHLCHLPKRCLMKPPTRFLVETYRFQNRFCLMCNARALLDWTMTIIEPTMEGVDRPTMTHNLVIVSYVTLLFCLNEDIYQRFCSFVGNDESLFARWEAQICEIVEFSTTLKVSRANRFCGLCRTSQKRHWLLRKR